MGKLSGLKDGEAMTADVSDDRADAGDDDDDDVMMVVAEEDVVG